MDRLQENMLTLGSSLSDNFAPNVYKEAKKVVASFPMRGTTFNIQATADVAAFAILQALTTLTERTSRGTLTPLEANIATIATFKMLKAIMDGFSDSVLTNVAVLALIPEYMQRDMSALATEIYGDKPDAKG